MWSWRAPLLVQLLLLTAFTYLFVVCAACEERSFQLEGTSSVELEGPSSGSGSGSSSGASDDKVALGVGLGVGLGECVACRVFAVTDLLSRVWVWVSVLCCVVHLRSTAHSVQCRHLIVQQSVPTFTC